MASPPDESVDIDEREHITVWRITHEQYAADAFSGEGAKTYGGRFNSPGVPMVYTAGSLALATLELLVRLNRRRRLAPYVRIAASFPANLLAVADDLPEGWDDRPYGRVSQEWGDTWTGEQVSLALKVPSVVEPLESNYLINPGHPEVDRLDVGPPTPLNLDPRLPPIGPAESE